MSERTPYDNSVSYLYKQALRLDVPVRYIIIQPGRGQLRFFVEFFDLDDDPNATFTTIFQYVRDHVFEGQTLSQIWDKIRHFQGDAFNPGELVQIWFHSVPEYRVQNSAVFDQILAFLQYIGEIPMYPSIEGYLDYYNQMWLPRFHLDLELDRKTVEKFNRTQSEISQISPLYHSPIELDSLTVTYDLEYPNNPLPDIFNSAFTSYIIPFIQYNISPLKGNEEARRYYKIYQGRSIDSQPNYTNIIIPSSEAVQGETIYLSIWSGPLQEAPTGKKEGFLLAWISYLPDEKIIRTTIQSPVTEEVNPQVMIKRLLEHIPTFNFEIPERAIHENRISGSFVIYNTGILDEIFLHLVTNDPLFSNYLYVEEAQKTFAAKQRLIVHYRGVAAGEGSEGHSRAVASASLNQEKIPFGETVPILTPKGIDKYTVPVQEGLIVIRIKMTKALSRKVADQFVRVISRLLRRYLERGPALLEEYLRFIPEYSLIIQQKEDIKGTSLKVEGGQLITNSVRSKAEQLREYAPDLFVSGYPRQCQQPHQPLPITQDQIPLWEASTFIHPKTKIEEHRQVLPFPAENPKYFFICPDNDYPYPGVKPNKGLSNHETYPVLPCCFGTDRLNKPGSKWNQLYLGETEVVARNTGKNYILTTSKILAPGRIAVIHLSITNFLRKYNDEAGNIYRYGVPRDTNSFIHCIATAVRFPSYINSNDRGAWAEDFRSRLFSLGLLPELMRQELFDMNNDDILHHATNQEEFFDPLFYYRALEELFQCNIYIFALDPKDRKTGTETSLLQLPRHKYFHAHPPNPKRPLVIIVRHIGSESNSATYPQCELIIDQLPSQEKRMLFDISDESMNEILSPALSFVGRTITWQILDQARPTLTARQNVYSAINYRDLFGQIKIQGQVIDSSGKARMFLLKPQWGNPEHTETSSLSILVNVPPTAPLNVPEFEPRQELLPRYSQIIQLFGTPKNVTTNTTGVSGLWFSAGDLQFAFYCPCQSFPLSDFRQEYPDVSSNSDLTTLTVPLVSSKEISALDRIRRFRRSSSFLNQILQYLYLVAERPSDINLFLGNIAAMLAPEISREADSFLLYDMTSLGRILPEGDLPTILVSLSLQLPNIFPGGRLLIFDERMYLGVRYFLLKWSRDIEGIDLDRNSFRELRDFYTSKEDFKIEPREFFLTDLLEYNAWSEIYVLSSNLQQRGIQNLKENIQTSLHKNAFSYQEPYIYQQAGNTTIGTSLDPRQDKFYLIQNVAGGDFQRAIQVAYTWFLEKRNPGFNSERFKESTVPVYAQYRITQNGSALIEKNETGGNAEFLEILNYDNRAFAAMLPIL